MFFVLFLTRSWGWADEEDTKTQNKMVIPATLSSSPTMTEKQNKKPKNNNKMTTYTHKYCRVGPMRKSNQSEDNKTGKTKS